MKLTKMLLLCAAVSLMFGITAYGGNAGDSALLFAARGNSSNKTYKYSDPGDSVHGKDLVFKALDATHTKVYDYDLKVILTYPEEMEYTDIFQDAVTAKDPYSDSYVVGREVTDMWLHFSGDDVAFIKAYYRKYILKDFNDLYGDGRNPTASSMVFKNDNGKNEALSSMTGQLENSYKKVDVAAALYERTHRSTGEKVYLVRTVFSPTQAGLRKYYWWETSVKGCKR